MDMTAIVLCGMICFTVMVCVSMICKAIVDYHDSMYSAINEVVEKTKQRKEEENARD